MEMLRMTSFDAPALTTGRVDLSREVFGVLGIPIDRVGLTEAVQKVDAAVELRQPFLMSTPNVNFLISSQVDAEFRESLLSSDLCTVDGMPIVWIARLLGVPIEGRVSGADIFNELKFGRLTNKRNSIFLFGGADEAAAHVGKSLNSDSIGLKCVGTLNPGFGSVEELSNSAIVNQINAGQADILGVFLTAGKAQIWLLKNHDKLTAPVRVQFGATINFENGTVMRAPALLRRLGFEWLWRIKEEPKLWRRYFADGLSLLRILVASVLPLAIGRHWLRLRGLQPADLTATVFDGIDHTRVYLAGSATEQHMGRAITCFERLLEKGRPFIVDLSGIQCMDPRFFGLLLMVRKVLRTRGETLKLCGAPPAVRKIFRLNGFYFLLETVPSL